MITIQKNIDYIEAKDKVLTYHLIECPDVTVLYLYLEKAGNCTLSTSPHCSTYTSDKDTILNFYNLLLGKKNNALENSDNKCIS